MERGSASAIALQKAHLCICIRRFSLTDGNRKHMYKHALEEFQLQRQYLQKTSTKTHQTAAKHPVTDGKQTQLIVTPIARRPSLSDGTTENTFSTHIRIHQTGKPPPAASTAKKLTELQRLLSLSANIIENIYSYLCKHAHWQEVDQTRSGLPLAGSFKLRHTETASELSTQHSDGTMRLTADIYIYRPSVSMETNTS